MTAKDAVRAREEAKKPKRLPNGATYRLVEPTYQEPKKKPAKKSDEWTDDA